jgi:ABC-type nickel/cobalt efflux system permease component RcnA
MFFTRLGTIAAWLGFLAAAFRIGTALFIVFGVTAAEDKAFMAARYLGSKSTGAVIDQALIVAACAIALGILVEISRAVRR